MARMNGYGLAVGLVLAATAALTPGGARAGDFFSSLFGALTGSPPPIVPQPSTALPFGRGDDTVRPPQPLRSASGGQTAYCVRTCDGRYFPAPPVEGESRTAACNSLCPASETKVVYGGSIDTAATESGKLYADLPNAFRYRNELVAGCTCNGRDSFGLAAVKIDDDHTLRKGDMVEGPHGLVVANGRADRRTAVNFTPVSPSLRAKFARVPVVASE